MTERMGKLLALSAKAGVAYRIKIGLRGGWDCRRSGNGGEGDCTEYWSSAG